MGEIGITGGEEDGVDNTGEKADALYTKPEQVYNVYKALSPISPAFSIAAAFDNVHGVYKSGNVVLSPHLLKGHQEYAQKMIGCDNPKPLWSCTEEAAPPPRRSGRPSATELSR